MNRILSIVQVGHPVLREPTAELTPETLQTNEIQQFIDDLMLKVDGDRSQFIEIYKLLSKFSKVNPTKILTLKN